MEGIKDHLFKETLTLLKLKPEARTPRDIATLMEATADVGFFKQISRDYSTDEVHRECVKIMTLVCCEAGQYIFRYGDTGDSFYVVLRGEISIQVPITDLSAPIELDELEKPIFGSEQPQGSRRGSQLEVKNAANIGRDEILNQSEMKPVRDLLMTEVRTRGEGTAFGELALLTGQPRAASIQCLKESWIAKLTREDFTRILKHYEERRLMEMADFLRKLNAFENWTRYSLIKITYLFETKRFKNNQVVYRCGDPALHAYIIKSGEFKFTYTIDDEAAGKTIRLRRGLPKKQLQMYIKGSTELFGDDDLMEGETKRSLTCVCTSLVGEVLVIDKNDFMRRLQVPQTWDYLTDRHNAEEKWKTKRIAKLKSTEGLMRHMEEPPLQDEEHLASNIPKVPFIRSLHNGARAPRHYRSSSCNSQPAKLSEKTSKATSFFRTEIDQALDIEEINSQHPTHYKPNTPLKLPRDAFRPRSKTQITALYNIHMAPKGTSRPPPNFFVSALEAVNSRYKFRPLIAGRPLAAMTPLERSFHRKLGDKFKTRKFDSISEERRSPTIGFY